HVAPIPLCVPPLQPLAYLPRQRSPRFLRLLSNGGLDTLDDIAPKPLAAHPHASFITHFIPGVKCVHESGHRPRLQLVIVCPLPPEVPDSSAYSAEPSLSAWVPAA